MRRNNTRMGAWDKLLITGCVLAAGGCGGPRTVPIEASFVYDGEPLADAGISFIRTGDASSSNGRPAFGGTDARGVATLTTYERGDGVPPGDYKVVVIKPPSQSAKQSAPEIRDERSMIQASSMGSAAQAAQAKTQRTILPEVYADPGRTPLTCTVEPGKREHRFELSSNP